MDSLPPRLVWETALLPKGSFLCKGDWTHQERGSSGWGSDVQRPLTKDRGSDLPFSWWLWNSTRRLPVTETKCTCELMLLNIWKELARRKWALLGTIWNPHQLPSRHTSFEVKGQFCSFYSVGAQCTLPNLHGALSIKHDTIHTSRHNGSKVHRQRTTGTEAQHASLRGVEVLSS